MNRKTFIEKSARGLFLGALAFVSLVFFKRSQVELESCGANQLCKSCKKFDACQLPEKTIGDEHPATKKILTMSEDKAYNRRDFIQSGMRISLALTLGGVAGLSLKNTTSKDYVWQIDPFECTQCGRCATECVKSPSAVKCIHAYDLCGYCDLCGGYLKPDAKERNTAAENMLCPTAAIERKYIEEPYYEYVIIEDLCIGCAKCVKGCSSFGNGSLHLQISHDLCDNCNECAIARVCPSKAIKRVPADDPYIIKGDFTKNEGEG